MNPDPAAAPTDSLEAEFCRLLELAPSERAAALDRLAVERPADAAVLRRRIGYLDAFELLDDPPAPDLHAGSTLGDYRIDARLDAGAFATVYAATHLPTARSVAIKVLRCTAASHAADGRFRREWGAIARLSHPGICPLYDVGEVDGRTFLVMRRVAGVSLAERIARTRDADPAATSGVAIGDAVGPGRVEAIASMIERVAQALHHAHERGLVHRDLKPANILLEDGEPVVIDFGLVGAAHAADPRLTATGETVGTPRYLAPEALTAVAGTLPDRTADVYGLGLVLYECLTLRPAFPAEIREQLYRDVLGSAPADPRRVNRFVSADLAVVLQTALAKDPDHRYRTALAFAEDLRRARLGAPIAARRPSPVTRIVRWSRRYPAAAALLVALVASVSAAGVQAWHAQQGLQRARMEAAAAAQHVAWTRLLASTVQLERARARADDLFPPFPEMAPRLAAWLATDGEPAQALLAETRSALQLAVGGGPTPRSRLLAAGLTALERDLARFVEAPDGTLADVRARLAWASTVHERSVEAFSAAWHDARAAIRSSPLYDGLDLPPQVGLVPLGPDPVSGYWEFADLLSGEGGTVESVPRRDASGKLVLAPANGIVLVLLPGGTCRLGAQADDPAGPNHDAEAYPEEGPTYEVRLDPFLIGKHEFTQAQWRRLCGHDPSYFQAGAPHIGRAHSPLQPVERVTWHAAHEAMRRLGFALPTVAQWEYAARGGKDGARYAGGDVASLEGFENVADRAAVSAGLESASLDFDDGFVQTSPIGSFRANPFGLHDVYGNVSEWCRDAAEVPPAGSWWLAETSARPGDGLRGQPASGRALRVLKGGTCGSSPRSLRSAFHAMVPPELVGPHGVRPVRPLTGAVDD